MVKLLLPSKTCYNYARNFKLGMYEHTHIQFQKIYLLVPKVLLILLMSAFFGQNSAFFGKNSPNKHLLVLKTSSRRLQDMSWIRLQQVFSVTILRLPRRFEDVLKTSWRRLGRRKIVMLKTSSRRLQDMSWRRLVDMSWRRLEDMSWRCLKTCLEDLLKILWRQTKYLLGISVYLSWDLTNLNVYLTSLYFANLYQTTLKRIQNALITGLVLWN